MNEIVTGLWAQTRLSVWPERYWLVSMTPGTLDRLLGVIAASSPHFAALVMERDEVSLTVCDEVWQAWKEQFAHKEVAGPFKIITFALDIDLGVCGYLLPAAARLAEAGISILAQCAYLKDHLAIKEEDTARAVRVLDKLIAECRRDMENEP
jgi:hypothetical protein